MTAAKTPALPLGTRFVAVDDPNVAGTLLGWSGEGQVTRLALAASFEAAGLSADLLPPLPELETILTRCLTRARPPGNFGKLQVRPVERGSLWAIVRETKVTVDGKRTLRHEVLFQASVGPGPAVQFTVETPGENFAWLENAIREDFAASHDNLSTTDVSSWLAGTLGARFNAVQVLRGQRNYFVPADRAAAARAFVAAVMAASGYAFSDIPAMRAETAIKAFLAALERETLAAAEQIQADLAKKVAELAALDAGDTVRRPAAMMARRLDAVAIMREKLTAYGEMFGRPAEAAANAIARLKANIFTTLQYAEGKAEGRNMDAPRLLELDDSTTPDCLDQTSPAAEARFAGLAEDTTADLSAADPTSDGAVDRFRGLAD